MQHIEPLTTHAAMYYMAAGFSPLWVGGWVCSGGTWQAVLQQLIGHTLHEVSRAYITILYICPHTYIYIQTSCNLSTMITCGTS